MIGKLKGNISLTQKQIDKLLDSDLRQKCRLIIGDIECDFVFMGVNYHHVEQLGIGSPSVNIDLAQVLSVDMESEKPRLLPWELRPWQSVWKKRVIKQIRSTKKP